MRINRLIAWSVVLCSLASLSAPAAPPAPDRLLPDATVAVAIVPVGSASLRAWDATQFAKFYDEPLLKPFIHDLETALRRDRIVFGTLALEWAALRSLASSGSVAVAMLPPDPSKRAPIVLLADTSGREKELDAFLAKLAGNVRKHGGSSKFTSIRLVPTTVWSLKQTRSTPAVDIHVIVKDKLLMISDRLSVLEGILSRWTDSKATLSTVSAYQETVRRNRFANGASPHLIWFINADGLSKAVKTLRPPPMKGKDYFDLLKDEGFAEVQGMGGAIRFDDGAYDLCARYSVITSGKHEKAMRILRFPNRAHAAASAWVPADVSRWVTVNWDMSELLETVGTMFDRVAGKSGDFKAVLEALRDDKDGPQVDVKKDLIDQLTGKVTLISDCPPNVPDRGNRILAAFDIKTGADKALAAALNRLLQGEEGVTLHRKADKSYWMISSKPKKQSDDKMSVPERLTLAVANRRLLFSNGTELLERILLPKGESLATQADYLAVDAELRKLVPGEACLHHFSRLAEELRPTYELLKSNRFDRAETAVAQLLRMVISNSDSRIDVSKMPEFAEVRNHLRCAGSVAVSRSNGWDFVTIVLKK